MDSKTTLRIYRSKGDIGEEGIYRNTFVSVFMFRGGTWWGCGLLAVWNSGIRTVEHHMMDCGCLREARERCGVGAEEALLFEGRTEERVERYTVNEDVG